MPPLRGARAAGVFACFAAGYLLSYGLRAINAVIAPALAAELGLSNADLGMLSSAYFLAFASVQLPLGAWLDNYGARRTEAALLLCAALGAAIFASSSTLAGLWIGRALIGVGVSACLMAAFHAYRQWFAPERQGQLASWMLVAGTGGALFATVPVTLALPLLGWRGVFWLVTLLLLLVAAAIFFLLGAVEREFAPSRTLAPGAAKGGYRVVIQSPYFWRMGLLGLVNQGSFVALQTLWAGPWMTGVLGKTPAQAAAILFAINLVLMLGYLAQGWSAPRLAARGWRIERIIAIGLGGALLAQGALLAASGPDAWLWWLALALCVPVTTLAQSHVGLAFPAALSGRANSAYNLLLFVGAFAAQWGIGVLADAFKAGGLAPPQALRAAIACVVALQVASYLHFLFSRSQPDPVEAALR
ncbi:MAG: MFS transporter [Pseudomonadota bacterium]